MKVKIFRHKKVKKAGSYYTVRLFDEYGSRGLYGKFSNYKAARTRAEALAKRYDAPIVVVD